MRIGTGGATLTYIRKDECLSEQAKEELQQKLTEQRTKPSEQKRQLKTSDCKTQELWGVLGRSYEPLQRS